MSFTRFNYSVSQLRDKVHAVGRILRCVDRDGNGVLSARDPRAEHFINGLGYAVSRRKVGTIQIENNGLTRGKVIGHFSLNRGAIGYAADAGHVDRYP